jgi:hypothetical protein
VESSTGPGGEVREEGREGEEIQRWRSRHHDDECHSPHEHSGSQAQASQPQSNTLVMEGNNDSQEVVDLKHYRPFFRELDLSTLAVFTFMPTTTSSEPGVHNLNLCRRDVSSVLNVPAETREIQENLVFVFM